MIFDFFFIVPFMISITATTVFLTAKKQIHFPLRKTGGWWSVWRWRFEFLLQYMEYDTVQFMRQNIKPGMTTIDVGAHIGYYTMLFSDLVGSNGTVISFEPHPDNLQKLTQNIRTKKNHSIITIEQKAITDSEGERTLFLSKGHSAHSIILPSSTSESIKVETTTIDHYVKQHNIKKIDLIKIDAEGAEPIILEGMIQTISDNPKMIIVIESNENALQKTGYTTEKILTQLNGFGFDCMPLSNDASHKSGTQNFACVPRSMRIVDEIDYKTSSYLTKKRWFSYWYQIDEVRKNCLERSVLEIGPGNNIVRSVLNEIGYNVKTADSDPKTNPDYLSDIRNLPSQITEIFDTILCCQLLEHVPFDDIENILKDMHKICKNHLIITLPYTSAGTYKPYITLKLLPFIKPFSWLGIFNLFPKIHRINRIDGHQWEIGKKDYHLNKIFALFSTTGWSVEKHYPIFENPYHYMFVLKKYDNR